MISAKIIQDSMTLAGDRLTTVECTYPRFIHSQVMTHRMFSRNAASSRAIPLSKYRKQVQENPATPLLWGKNGRGMSAKSVLDPQKEKVAKFIWRQALKTAILQHEHMEDTGVHKQIANRILEPFSHITVIITATEWDNFFFQRLPDEAQPEIQELARCIYRCLEKSYPETLEDRQWHLPYITQLDGEESLSTLKQVSVARCARVSYLNHDGIRDISKDLELYDRLWQEGHMSPFEHIAQPAEHGTWNANFYGWRSLRESVKPPMSRNLYPPRPL